MSNASRASRKSFLATLGADEIRGGFDRVFEALIAGSQNIGPCCHCGAHINFCLLECPECKRDSPFLSASHGNNLVQSQGITDKLRMIWVSCRGTVFLSTFPHSPGHTTPGAKLFNARRVAPEATAEHQTFQQGESLEIF